MNATRTAQIGWVILSGVLVVACSSDPDPADQGAGGAGGDGSGSGAGPSSGSGGGTAGPGGGPSVEPNPEHAGIVQIFNGTIQDGTETITGTFGIAYFFDAPGADGGDCTVTTHGDCKVRTCTGGTPSTPTSVSAGTITVEGKETLILTPDATNDYELAGGTGLLWDPGQTITISAAGAEVPAFTHALQASSPVTVTSPAAPPADTPLSLDRSKDFVLTWTGGTTGAVTTLWKVEGTDPFVSIQCAFAASDGEGTVPAAALQALPESGSGDILLVGGRLDTIATGVYTVQVGLNSIPAWGPEYGSVSFTASN
jgi:hypothetical protein